MNYKAAIFDLDGTLLDSLEDLADSMNSVLEREGFPTHDTDKYKYFVGDGMKKLVARSLPTEGRQDAYIEQCLGQLRKEYHQRWNNKTRPYEGIPELLDKLSSLRMRMAVLSNKPQEFTKVIVDKMLSRWNFEMVLGMRPNVPAKPDPTSALEICDTFGILPKEFLYLGDTNTDMTTANAAGMYAVGVLWGFRDAEELMESGAKTLIEHPAELLRLL